MSASPSLSHMTSFYITAVSSAENEERPRMRIKRRKKRKKTQPERHGPVQQQQQHSVPITKRERERAGLNGKQHHCLFHPASPPTDLELEWEPHKYTQTVLRCPESPPSTTSSSKCPLAVTLGTL